MVERAERRERRVGAAVALLASAIGCALVLTVAALMGTSSIPMLLRDVAALCLSHPLNGLLSNLGSFLWFASSAILAFSTYAAWDRLSPRYRAFLIGCATLSALLWIDDFFMVHEWIAPRDFRIHEKLVLLVGACLAGIQFLVFAREYLSFRPLVILAALAFLSFSVMVDAIPSGMTAGLGDWLYFAEDMPKWIGIVLWTYWHIAIAHEVLRSACFVPEIDTD